MKSVRLVPLLLCAAQVFSLPITSVDSEDDTKVLKCIVEVISDTLSNPKPVPITPDCRDTLQEDERIISILRHQNLLKELQQLAAQGALERLQKSKKSSGDEEEELSGVLDKQNKASSSEASEESSRHTRPSESEEAKRQPEKEPEEKSSERPQEGDSAEELENNDISKTEETPEDEDEIDNHITDEINNMELPRDNGEDSGEDRHPGSKKDPEDEEPADHDKDQDSNETENEEDDTQREDNSMKIPEDFNKDEPRSESSKEDTEQMADCSDDETSSKDLEDAKRWNKMDELAKELRAKRCAKRAAGEEEPDRSMKDLPKDQKDEPGREEQEDVGQQQQSPADSDLQMSKRPDERKEEGSARRKAEEPDSLAAIEAELENVAHKLHDLRRG